MSIFKKISVFTMLLFMSVLLVSPVNSKAATVGQPLRNPESGWQRIDNKNALIQYNGSGTWIEVTNSDYYLGSYVSTGYGKATNQETHYINFKFYGSKLRLIGYIGSLGNTKCYITVDGTTYNYSQYSSSDVRGAINYELNNLSTGLHDVKIYSVNTSNSKYGLILDAIDIDDTGYLVDYYQPTNLVATPGNTKVILSWDEVAEATGYIIHYGAVSGNLTETKIVTGGAITTTNIGGLLNETKYYFTVTAIINGIENSPSIEVTATPIDDSVPTDHVGNTAALELTMTNGGIKIYNVSITDLDNFLTWYENRSNGEGKAYYTFSKTTNIAPYLSVKEYVSFDKISSFEVKEYNQ